MTELADQYYLFAREQWIHTFDTLGIKDEKLKNDILTRPEEVLNIPKESKYHNVTHCMRVAVLSVEIGMRNHLENDQLVHLFKAGTFHDAGHSCLNTIPDADNVAKSITIAKDYGLSTEELKLINATLHDEFKKQRLLEHGSIEDKTIADADLANMVDMEYGDAIVDGLLQEGAKQASANFAQVYGCFTEGAQRFYTERNFEVDLIQ